MPTNIKTSYKYRSASFQKKKFYLIMHYTAANFAISLEALTKKFSAHYLVPKIHDDPSYQEQGMQVFALVAEADRAWHAGVSAWENKNNLNDYAIGIETVNLASYSNRQFHFKAYEEEQINTLIALTHDIIQRNDFLPQHILGHSDIAPTRKSDPGPTFPWKRLYEAGIGAWYDEKSKEEYIQEYTENGLPTIRDIQSMLREYGYLIEVDNIPGRETKMVLRAFQMHFRPQNYNGIIDIETIAILKSLVDKYSKSL